LQFSAEKKFWKIIFSTNSTEFSAENHFPCKKNVRKIGPWCYSTFVGDCWQKKRVLRPWLGLCAHLITVFSFDSQYLRLWNPFNKVTQNNCNFFQHKIYIFLFVPKWQIGATWIHRPQRIRLTLKKICSICILENCLKITVHMYICVSAKQSSPDHCG
jgi:hypothetical protein